VIAGCGGAAAVSLLTDVPSQPGLAATAALYLAGAAAARCARPMTVAGTAAGGAAVLVLGRTDLSPAWAWALSLLGLLGWLLALGLGLGLRVADGRRVAALAGARREERLELARDLHDVVAHHVAAIVVQAQATRLLSQDGIPPEPHQLAAIETAGTEALAAMRRVIGLLREQDPGPRSEPESVTDLIRRFAAVGPPVDVDGEPDPGLPVPVAGTVYRLVQEGLTNVRKHAGGAPARVRIAHAAGTVHLEVSDQGSGPHTPHPVWDVRTRPPGGFGLVGLRERVEFFGGRLEAGPAGDGFRLAAELPA
jgi:signal transduction histidine kinase